MSSEDPNVAQENDVSHRSGRRRSITPVWDDVGSLLSVQDVIEEATAGGEGTHPFGLLSSFDENQNTNNVNAAGMLGGSIHSSSGSDEGNVGPTELIAQKLVEANPSFGKIHASVSQHLKELLQTVRKKRGVSLVDSNKEQHHAAYTIVSQVPPFSYLPNQERQNLVQDLFQVEYQDGEVIVNQDDRDDDVYILAEGRIVMVQIRHHQSAQKSFLQGKSAAKFLGFLDAPAYFGEWGALFDASRNAKVIAGSATTKVYRMEGSRFTALLQEHSGFRLKLALSLRQNGIFSPIESFVAIVRRAVENDTVFDFPAILESYRKMVPAIHANLHSSQLDTEGWTYAVRRLPDNITSTYIYLLSNHIPMPFLHPQLDLHQVQVKTVARRRQAFALDRFGGGGKLLVVMREKYSDVLDFLSLLCAHIHESAKLRNKLVRPAALDVIHNCLWSSSSNSSGAPMPDNVLGHNRQRFSSPASLEDQSAALQKLPLTDEEKDGLKTLWPKDFLYRIWDIITLHENIQVRSDLSSTYIDSTDRWAENIRREILEMLCPEGNICLKTELTTHIISSNTTSVRNLISPYILKNKGVIQDWGNEAHPDIMDHGELSESDKLCALCNAYMQSHPDCVKEQDTFDKKCFKTLRNTGMTGIQVELIDLNALEDTYADHDIDPDPFLAPCFPRYKPDEGWSMEESGKRKCRLLINIDYAFGKQAEQLISALSLLVDKSLSSVGVMGKAGGLQGRRGDIIVADYLIHQEGDEQTLIDNTGVDREALHTLSGRAVHSGGVLTVLGTLLQDSRLLNFYKKLYGCVSLEMEGSFYARELRRYKKAGLLSDNVHLRFLYYVSDTPLSTNQTETLSQDLSIAEVIPPQYAVTRALLKPVLAERS